MNDTEPSEKDNKPPYTVGRVLKGLGALTIGMSMYAYFMLSTNKAALPTATVIFSILEIVQVRRRYQEATRLETVCEAAYFLALGCVAIGIYRTPISGHLYLLLGVIFYRPYYTLYSHPRLALVLGLLIIAAVLPIACGIATDSDSVGMLMGLYALLVSGLWVFCSKFGETVFDF
jgi:hypothetical protein